MAPNCSASRLSTRFRNRQHIAARLLLAHRTTDAQASGGTCGGSVFSHVCLKARFFYEP